MEASRVDEGRIREEDSGEEAEGEETVLDVMIVRDTW
jgi:hypothetical protein